MMKPDLSFLWCGHFTCKHRLKINTNVLKMETCLLVQIVSQWDYQSYVHFLKRLLFLKADALQLEKKNSCSAFQSPKVSIIKYHETIYESPVSGGRYLHLAY